MKLPLLFLFVLMVTSVYALDISTGLQAYYNLTGLKDSKGSWDLSSTGTVTDTSGILQGAKYYSSGSNYYSTTAANFPGRTAAGESVTFNFWVNFTACPSVSNRNIFYMGGTSGKMYFGFQISTTCQFTPLVYDGTKTYYPGYSGSGVALNKYTMMTLRYENKNVSVFVNGVLNSTGTDTFTGTKSDDKFYFGVESIHSQAYAIDEFAVYNVSLSPAQIVELYNSGTGCNPVINPDGCTGAPATPTLALQSSLVNNTQNYTKFYLNFTYNGTFTSATTDMANCTFFVNQANNGTYQANLSVNNKYNLTIPSFTGWYNVSFNCSNFEVSASTITYKYRIDNVPPFMLTSFVNNTVYALGDIVTFYANFSDANLFVYNISWYNVNGALVQNIFAENITSTFAQNTSTYTPIIKGNYTIGVWVFDSHNPIRNYAAVKPMPWYFDNNNLIADGDITFTGNLKALDAKGNQATYFYLSDNKYKVKLTFKDTALSHEINLSTPGKLIFVPEYVRGYKGHFVYLDHKRYIDFMGANVRSVDSVKVSQNKYKLVINLYAASDEVELETIGDLNSYYAVYRYSVVDEQITYLASIDQTLKDIKAELVNMYITPTILILIPSLFGFMLLLGSFFLGEDHPALKISLFMLSMLSVIISLWLGSIVVGQAYPTFTEFQDALGTITFWSGTIFAVLVFYFLLYLVYKMFTGMKQEKEDKLKY